MAAGLGLLAIPGIGPVVALGPLASLGAGAVAGGVAGGIPEEGAIVRLPSRMRWCQCRPLNTGNAHGIV